MWLRITRCALQFTFEEAEDCWGDGEYDDAHHHGSEVVAYERNIAEKITSKDKAAYPHNTPNHAEHEKTLVVHFTHTGDKRRKGADDGHEARQKNGLAAMAIHKILRFINMCLVDGHAFVAHDEFAKVAPNPIIDVVAEQCCCHQNTCKQHGVERTL